MKFNKAPVQWRGGGFTHHKDLGRKPRGFHFQEWILKPSVVEPCGESPHAIAYPATTAKLLHNALQRCSSISMDRDVMEGQPCIAGTRIPVRAVLRALEQYGSIKEVRNCYPHLTAEQVEDALYFSQLLLELPSGIDETALAVG